MPETHSSTQEDGAPARVEWRDWGAAAFEEAAATGRPILLNLTAFWCDWCRRMDQGTWSDRDLVRLIGEQLIPVRVDTDRYPHVQDRYMAGGWPTTAFLMPTGEVLWSGTYVDAAQFRAVADSVLGAWGARREELEREISRRHQAVESARGRTNTGGLVRREPADDVLTAARAAFDARNGGFGDAPKFPVPELIELLYVHGREDAACTMMADQTLDGMLAGELWDAVDGGFYRYVTEADWTSPHCEKLLEVNAGLLEAYAVGAALRGRADWREIAERTVAWVDGTLGLDGLWSTSQHADPNYFGAAAEQRRRLERPAVDPTLYTAPVARWVHALAFAGARLDRRDWIARADEALRALLSAMAAPGGVHHFRATGEAPALDILLVDTLESARAALMLAQATGSAAWLDTARSLARQMETRFWSDAGGFSDRVRSDHDVGMLRYHDKSFETNASAARLLLDLAHVSGERNWRGLAERTLASISGVAGRYGTSAAVFALATEAYFDAPAAVFIAVPPGTDAAAAPLRSAAFALPFPSLRVWTVPAGHAVGPQRFPADGAPVAWLWTRRGCAGPLAAAELATHAGAAAL
jgi:uncharacterized protein